MPPTSPLEDEIQRWVERLVEQDAFASKITGREALPTKEGARSWMPGLGMDSHVRRKLVAGAAYTLDLLTGARLVAARRDVSLTRGEHLFPDLLLVNGDRNVLIVVEIKRSSEAEREAATELAAYEQEVRNHLPLLGNCDICFVVISTEFDTLLSHSLAGLAATHGRRILCLHLDYSADEWQLRLHVPSGWHPLSIRQLSGEDVQTLSVVADEGSDGVSASVLARRVAGAFEAVVREAERGGGAGFALLWRNTLSDKKRPTLGITLGVINPFAVHRARSASSGTRDTALDSYLRAEVDHRFVTPSVLWELAVQAVDRIGSGSAMVEGELSWADWQEQMQGTAHPLQIDFWGSLGEISRDYVVNPSVEHEFAPDVHARAAMWTEPSVGIPLLDEILAEGVFARGDFGAGSILRFGALLGSIITILATLRESPEGHAALQAVLSWRVLRLQGAMREVAIRARDARLEAPPHGVTRVSRECAIEAIAHINKLADWFHGVFLASQTLLQEVFRDGLEHHDWLDAFLRDAYPRDPPHALREKSEEWLPALVRHWQNDWQEPSARTLRGLLAEHWFHDMSAVELGPDEVLARLPAIEPELHLENYAGPFLQLFDVTIGPAWHDVRGPLVIPADMVEDLRASIVERSKHSDATFMLVVSPNRTVSIRPTPRPMSRLDAAEEVWVAVDETALLTIRRVLWSDLREGHSISSGRPGQEVILIVK